MMQKIKKMLAKIYVMTGSGGGGLNCIFGEVAVPPTPPPFILSAHCQLTSLLHERPPYYLLEFQQGKPQKFYLVDSPLGRGGGLRGYPLRKKCLFFIIFSRSFDH